MSAAGYYDMIADQGATFSQVITWKSAAGTPVNLTGYSARMQVRERVTSATTELDLSSGGGNPRITLGGALGTITISVPPARWTLRGRICTTWRLRALAGW